MRGYEQFSALAAQCPELLILKRFDRLTARILLRQQAELLFAEEEFEAFIAADEQEDPEVTTRYEKIRNSIDTGHDMVHLAKLDEVAAKLKEYHETVLRAHAIRALDSPSRRSRSQLWKWLKSTEGGNNFLQGIEAGPWESERLEELLTLTPTQGRLDNWLSDTVTPLYHTVYGHRRKPTLDIEHGLGRLWIYKTAGLRVLGDIICALASSIIPVTSIQGLYWIPTTLGRLSMISGLIVAFSFLLMFVAACRRSEVFAATSAFAAILVVFLQGLDGSINCRS